MDPDEGLVQPPPSPYPEDTPSPQHPPDDDASEIPTNTTPDDPFDIIPTKSNVIIRRWKLLKAPDVRQGVEQIIPYLEDTAEPNQLIYFDGWNGLAASAVLRSLAEDPPPSLKKKFDRIIHLDCSSWKNERQVQKEIAAKLKLLPELMAIFDAQDEDDDFNGVSESSRPAIAGVARKINRELQGKRCLVVFHNGSDGTVDLNDLGIPKPADRLSDSVCKVLWTYRGRLRAIQGMKKNVEPKLQNSPVKEQELDYPWVERIDESYDEFYHPIPRAERIDESDDEFYHPIPRAERIDQFDDEQQLEESVDNSQVYLHSYFPLSKPMWHDLLRAEAAEMALHTYNKHGITSATIVFECSLYLLLLDTKDNEIMDYNWINHASNYWVCDGILREYQEEKRWEIAGAVKQHMQLQSHSSAGLLSLHAVLQTPEYTKRWVSSVIDSDGGSEGVPTVNQDTSSFFLAFRTEPHHRIAPLSNNMFIHSQKLSVLKLCNCTFSFNSPPFRFCRSLRFLGLSNCKDFQIQENGEEQFAQELEFFDSLWVLDICSMDWDLTLSERIVQRMSRNMMEVNINRGRIWSSNLPWSWGQLGNIRKLRIIEHTHPWEISRLVSITYVFKLELLDLSGNKRLRFLPGLSGATTLNTLVLDGCVRLKHVGPADLPPSIVTFSLDAGSGKNNKKPKISRISMAGCKKLRNFRLRGSLPNLEELDLSDTSVETLDLTDEVVQVPHLRRVILLGCEHLRGVVWPKTGMPELMFLNIDIPGGQEFRETTHGTLVREKSSEGCCLARVAIVDIRSLQLFVLRGANQFCWNTSSFQLILCLTSAIKDNGRNYHAKKTGQYTGGQLVGSSLHRSLIPMTQVSYSDVSMDKININLDAITEPQHEPEDIHMEIGEGISDINVTSAHMVSVVIFFMNRVKSLHVHDNASIATITPTAEGKGITCSDLKRFQISRCPKVDTVFHTNYATICFETLEEFSAYDLMMARCIWSRGKMNTTTNNASFAKLRSMHLYSCPRLVFVLPLSWAASGSHLPSLEILHIVCCGELVQIFPVEANALTKISTGNPSGVLNFPNLKHIHLDDLPKLHTICEASRMFAPELETVWVRGCWGLKRIPATHGSRPVVVDCEKDWWEKLEWDGLEVGHHCSLFELHHSKYYRKALPRGSVLW